VNAACPACEAMLVIAAPEVCCSECAWAATGEPWEVVTAVQAAVKPPEGGTSTGLPAIIWGKQIQDKMIVLPEELICGILHRGGKMVLGGGSKSFKTWCLADLAVCVASGKAWWGRATKQGKVIYLNLEVQAEFFETRIKEICRAKLMAVPDDLGVWNLRGHCTDHTELLPQLAEILKGEKCAAIILDPTYKVMAKSENAQEEVAALMNSIERLGRATGAAVIFGSHFAKGNAAGKEAIDRISGSGVFARDPDAILTMTKHEEDDVFAIDPILRNCPPIEPFCVQWTWPLMRLAENMDPADLKQINAPGRKKKAITPDEVASVLRNMGGQARGAHRTPGSLAKALAAQMECGLPSAEVAIETAIQAGLVESGMQNDGKQYVKYYKLKK
jgi:AAA domain